MSDAVTTPDPFTRVYEALWAIFEGHEAFCALVKPGNRVKFSGEDNPAIKSKSRRGDTPEVRIVADAVDPHLFRTSNGSSFNRIYRVEIYTNDLRMTAGIFPVEWAIFQAWVEAGDTLPNLDCVKQVRPVTERAPGRDQEARTKGWHSVLAVNVEMWFRTAHIPHT